MLDFKAITKLPIADLAEKLGWLLTESTTTIKATGEVMPQLVTTCPFSKTGGNTAFKITPTLNRFACFCPECFARRKNGGKNGGDIIELVRRLKGLEPTQVRQAAEEVQKLFGAGKADDNQPAPPKASEQPAKSFDFDPLKYLETLDPAHPALGSLGLSAETLRSAKAGYASKGTNQGRLAVWCEEIHAFIGVALTKDQEPKFKVPKGKSLPQWFVIAMSSNV